MKRNFPTPSQLQNSVIEEVYQAEQLFLHTTHPVSRRVHSQLYLTAFAKYNLLSSHVRSNIPRDEEFRKLATACNNYASWFNCNF